jgi:hypothetical protein
VVVVVVVVVVMIKIVGLTNFRDGNVGSFIVGSLLFL